MLSRCIEGSTQNQNDSINAILQKHCRKTRFCGKRCIKIGIFNTITEFNSGATTKAIVYESLGVQPGTNFYKATVDKEKIRIKNAAKKISDMYCFNRKKRRAKRKSKSDDKVTYMAGAFDLSKEPENISCISSKNLKQKSKSKTKKSLKHKASYSISNCNEEDNCVLRFIDEKTIPFRNFGN